MRAAYNVNENVPYFVVTGLFFLTFASVSNAKKVKSTLGFNEISSLPITMCNISVDVPRPVLEDASIL